MVEGLSARAVSELGMVYVIHVKSFKVQAKRALWIALFYNLLVIAEIYKPGGTFVELEPSFIQ